MARGIRGEIAAEYDDKRTKFMAKLGIEVIRFEKKGVLEIREFVLERIRAVLRARAQEPPLAASLNAMPLPSLPGGQGLGPQSPPHFPAAWYSCSDFTPRVSV
jgi:Protein of unknown function (DUF559)